MSNNLIKFTLSSFLAGMTSGNVSHTSNITAGILYITFVECKGIGYNNDSFTLLQVCR